MAMSDVLICNMALGNLSTRSTIASMDEGSTEAEACTTYYESTRDALLKAIRWNFARKQQALALLLATSNGQTPPVPWQYEYAYPSDMLNVRFLMPTLDSVPGPGLPGVPGAVTYVGPPVTYLISNDNDAQGHNIKVILTNQISAIAVYTYRCTDPTLFDSQFVDCFAAVLAAKLAMPLTGDKKLKAMCAEEAKTMILTAAASNGNEGTPRQDYMPDWMRVRGYLSDYAYSDLFFGSDPGEISRIV